MDIQTVLDRAEINDLLCKYSRGLDRVDEATLRSIYWDDAIEDRGPGLYIGNAQKWVDWTLGVLPVFAVTQHGLMNILIEVEGNVAWGETYFQAYHRFGRNQQQQAAAALLPADRTDIVWPEGDTEMILAGRYLDRFEKRGPGWRIARRTGVYDFIQELDYTDGGLSQSPPYALGARGDTDPSRPVVARLLERVR